MFFEDTFEKGKRTRKKKKPTGNFYSRFASHLDVVAFYVQEHVKPGAGEG